MSKAAVTVIRSLVACLILLGMSACETTTQRQAGEEVESKWYDGFTDSDGRTFRPLTEDETVWEVESRPDPDSGIAGIEQIFLASMPTDSLKSQNYMGIGCPCCPIYHRDSLSPPCCVDCFAETRLWINNQDDETTLGDTTAPAGSQPTTFGAEGNVIIEILCDVGGATTKDTTLGIQLDIAMMGEQGEFATVKSDRAHMRVMPQRSGADNTHNVLIRREFRVVPGQATIALTGQNLRSGSTVNVHWRAMRANVYYDFK
ncbi:MAG: hypothetical protein GF341_08470 [candidate division Zixibacteria bacterium]|nr:hypothetical protein [candidate division Zixibacteria bacterium]